MVASGVFDWWGAFILVAMTVEADTMYLPGSAMTFTVEEYTLSSKK
jgi:hypothetical protein